MIDLVITHLTHPCGPPWTLETFGDPWRPLATMPENGNFGHLGKCWPLLTKGGGGVRDAYLPQNGWIFGKSAIFKVREISATSMHVITLYAIYMHKNRFLTIFEHSRTNLKIGPRLHSRFYNIWDCILAEKIAIKSEHSSPHICA